ncbi:MAG: CBS domain-containing protein, partial [Candidatus Omnitrophica bacterium]|nr:CBS domain-containing protein [Candidatus Omnitrophota bacterium]
MTEKKIEDLLKEKKIFEIVNPRLVECAPEISIREVIGLMQRRRSGYAVLVADRQVFGILTETDIALKVMGRNVDLDLPVSEFMTPSPAVLSPTDSVGAAI